MPRTRSPISRSAAARPLPALAALAAFRPTPTQRRFMELATSEEAPLSISTVCAQLGIARSTYYRWLDDDGFRAWMALQWAQVVLADGGRLLSIARHRAETDYRYFKSLLELIFDPRGLGLLAAWTQRMAAAGDRAAEDSDDDDGEAPKLPEENAAAAAPPPNEAAKHAAPSAPDMHPKKSSREDETLEGDKEPEK